MKKFVLIALASAILVGCAPSYIRTDANALSDSELCSRLGYAKKSGNGDAFRSAYEEIEKRDREKTIKLSVTSCNAFLNMGIVEAENDAAIANTISKQFDNAREQQLQQPNAKPPLFTDCRNFDRYVSCITY